MLARLEREGRPAVLCTIVQARGSVPRHLGTKMLVQAEGRIEGTVGGGEMESRVVAEALEALRTGVPRSAHFRFVNPREGDPGVCGGEVEIFMDPIQVRPALLVVGGGHVGKALVRLGGWLNFRVVLCDDRPDYCNAQAVPGADEYLVCPLRELPSRFAFTPRTCIVLATRGVPIDLEGLPPLLQVPHTYLGVIGSRRRWLTARKALEARGISAAQLEAVRSPVGLELAAETPEEIAVSILAEIIMVQRGGDGRPMREGRPAAEPEA
jgi:xanthine dehydrogenase accessory factor